MIPLAFRARSSRARLLAPAVAVAVLFVNGPASAQERLTLQEHPDAITSVAFAPDGKTLATGCCDGIVRLWRTDTGEALTAFRGHAKWVMGVAFNADGKTLVSAGTDKTIRLWDVTSGRELAVLRGARTSIFCLALSPDGKLVATGGGESRFQGAGELLLWPIDGKEPIKLEGHKELVTGLAFSPDGKTLASASHDRTVCLWDALSGKRLGSVSAHASWVQAVTFSPDGKTLASLGHDNRVKLWPLVEARTAVVLKGHTHAPYALAFAPDGKTLASADDGGNVILWDFSRGAERKSFRAHDTIVYCLSFSPDGKTLATASKDRTVKFWDVGEPSIKQTDKPITIDKPFVSKAGGFQINMPSIPEEKTIKARFGDHEIEVHQFVSDQRDFEYTASYADYPDTIQKVDPKKFLESITDARVAGVEAKLKKTRDFKLGELPARDIVYPLTLPNGRLGWRRTRMVLDKTRLFEIHVAGKLENVAAKDADRFITSFEIASQAGKGTASKAGGLEVDIPTAVNVSELAPKLLAGQGNFENGVFVSQTGGFRINMPVSPRATTTPISTPTGPMEMRLFDVEQEDVAYFVGYMDFSDSRIKDRNAALDGSVDAILKGGDNTLISRRNIRLGTFPGREIELSTRLPGGRVANARERIFIVGSRYYHVYLIGTKDKVSKAGDAFLGSFELIHGVGKPFISYAGRFKVELPFTPKEETIKIPADIGDMDMHVFSTSQGDVAYTIAYADYPNQPMAPDLDAVVRNSVMKVDGTIRSRRDVRLGGIAGFEVEFTMPAPENQVEFARARFFRDNTRLYQLHARGPKNGVISASAEAFFKSFELLKEDVSARQSQPRVPGGSATTALVGPPSRPPLGSRSTPRVSALRAFAMLSLGGTGALPAAVLPSVATRRQEGPSVKGDASGELRQFKGHTKSVRSVALSPDGQHIISGGEDDTVRVWDVASGRELHTLIGHNQWVSSVAFCPDNKRALSAGYDRVMILWDVENGKRLRRFLGHDKTIWSVAISPDGKQALSGSGNIKIAGTPDDDTIRLWDLESGQELRRFLGHASHVNSVAFSPDGRRALSGSEDGTVRLWDLNSGEELRRCDAPNWILSVAFGPDNIQAVSGDLDRLVRLWDLDKGKEIRTFAGHKAAVNCVAFTPDGKRILSCGGGVLVTESVIILWDAITGEELCRFEGHTRPVTSLEIARDGRRFVSGSEDMTVRLWELPK